MSHVYENNMDGMGGTDLNIICRDEDTHLTPLMYAVQGGHLEVVRLTLRFGFDPNAAAKEGGWSPLMYVSQFGCPQICGVLLEGGARVNDLGGGGLGALAVRLSSMK